MTEVRKGAYRFDWQYEKSLLSQNKYMNEDCNNISINRNVIKVYQNDRSEILRNVSAICCTFNINITTTFRLVEMLL